MRDLADKLRATIEIDRSAHFLRQTEMQEMGCSLLSLLDLYKTFHPTKIAPRDFIRTYISTFLDVSGVKDGLIKEEAIRASLQDYGEDSGSYLEVRPEEFVAIVLRLKSYLGFTVNTVRVSNEFKFRFDKEELRKQDVDYQKVNSNTLVVPNNICLVGIESPDKNSGHVIAVNTTRMFDPKKSFEMHFVNKNGELRHYLKKGWKIIEIITLKSYQEGIKSPANEPDVTKV